VLVGGDARVRGVGGVGILAVAKVIEDEAAKRPSPRYQDSSHPSTVVGPAGYYGYPGQSTEPVKSCQSMSKIIRRMNLLNYQVLGLNVLSCINIINYGLVAAKWFSADCMAAQRWGRACNVQDQNVYRSPSDSVA
jgi:hypothetical protein